MRLLVCVTAPVNKCNAFTIKSLLKVAKLAGNDVIVIDQFKQPTLRKVAESAKCDVSEFKFVDVVKASNSANEAYKRMCKFIASLDVECIMFVGSTISPAFNSSTTETAHASFIKLQEEHTGLSGFNETKMYAHMLFAYAASCSCMKVLHYALDTREPYIGDIVGRDIKRVSYIKHDGAMLLPFYEFALSKSLKSNRGKEHDYYLWYEFYLCCSAYDKSRKSLLDIENIQLKAASKYIRIARNKKDVLFSQEEYFRTLCSSLTTLIPPAYDESYFNWLRFCEAVYAGCIPFVLNCCGISSIKKSFPGVYKIVNESLLIDDIHELPEKLKKVDVIHEVVNDIINTKQMLMVTNKEWIVSRWDKVLASA